MRRILDCCIIASIIGAATPALACWDGYRFSGEKVAAMMHEPVSQRDDVDIEPQTYDAAHMRQTHRLLSALETNLPEGVVFELIEYGPASQGLADADMMLHCDEASTLDCEAIDARFTAWRSGLDKGAALSSAQVYTALLEVTGQEPATLSDHEPKPYTIQIAASKDEKALHRRAFDGERAVSAYLPTVSDVYHGGFPSRHTEVFHIAPAQVDGGRVYRLLVGEFFSREHAEVALAALEKEGVEGFVRPATHTFYPK